MVRAHQLSVTSTALPSQGNVPRRRHQAGEVDMQQHGIPVKEWCSEVFCHREVELNDSVPWFPFPLSSASVIQSIIFKGTPKTFINSQQSKHLFMSVNVSGLQV